MEFLKCRPEIKMFAREMELQLQKHDAERGPDGWHNESVGFLLARLLEETGELVQAALDGGDVKAEAADVANFCMMIVEVTK